MPNRTDRSVPDQIVPGSARLYPVGVRFDPKRKGRAFMRRFAEQMGWVADRFSKGILIITGGFLGAASIYYLNVASTLEELLLANGLLGVAGGVSFPAIMALGVIDGRRTGAMESIMGLLAMSHRLSLGFTI